MSKSQPGSKVGRPAQFKAALALAEITTEAWCESEGECTPQHLYAVLKGNRESATLLAKIDAFIMKWLPTAAVAN